MPETISNSALSHVQSILKREKEVEESITAWTLERVKIQYAKATFLEFLNIDYGLGNDDLIHIETGVITRVAPAMPEIVSDPPEPPQQDER